MNPGLYLLIKLIAYCVWCYIGLRLFRPEQTQFIAGALRFGLIRLLMGLFFGVVIFFAAFTWANVLGRGMSQDVITYFGAYVPVRWIEWTIMAILLNPSVRRTPNALHWFIGNEKRDRLWRIGGIAISCVADIPFVVALGGVVPTGRFLC
jgi:hypothetical protein